MFNGENIKKKGSSYHRRHHVALVFQNYNLIDYLTPLENVRLVNKNADKKILSELGLDEKQINRNVPVSYTHLELDGPIGDGDHGANLARGMAAAIEAINSTEPQSAAEVFKAVSMALISKVGGASGPRCV